MRTIAATVAIALVLTGCAAQDTYPDATSDSLQEKVLEISTLAADGNPDDALTAIGELETLAETAHDAGDLTDERYDDITAAIDDVSTDLSDQVSAAEEEAPQETATAEPVPEEEVDTDPTLETDDSPGNKDKKDKKNDGKKGPKG